MESSKDKRAEKRGYELVDSVDSENLSQSKKPKLPGLASVIVEALKVDSLQRLCSSLEPLLRKIVSEEVERALAKLSPVKLVGNGRSTPPRIEGPGPKNLQIHFRTRMPPHLFTGGKVEGEQGGAIHVMVLDPNTGHVVQTGPVSVAKLNIVVLEGDFNEESDDEWTKEHFESHEVKEREGKRPLLTGDLQVVLKGGVGTLGDLSFTDNSSWIRSRKFRLGIKVTPGCCEETRVREGKTEAFAVKDHRGELYKKHYPPALHDEVWRLDRIAKDGALHKKLIQANIVTVEDFLRLLVRDPQKLRSILGSGMSNRMWENTVEHAKTCVLGGKLFVYYSNESNTDVSVVFNDIYELRGLIADGQFFSLESLTPNQKMSVDSLVKKAYENWNQVVEYDGKVLSSFTNSKNGSRIASAAPPTVHDNNHVTEQQYTSPKNRLQYVSLEPNQQFQIQNNSSYAGAADLSAFRKTDNPILGTASNDSQLTLTSSMNYNMTSQNPAVEAAYFPGDWSQPRSSAQGLEDIVAEEIRLRSSEMLESDDMQRLLKTINVGFGNPSESCYSYSLQYEPQTYQTFSEDQTKTSGKAVVGWIKLKAALRWGIFIRKRAAERRAQLTELN